MQLKPKCRREQENNKEKLTKCRLKNQNMQLFKQKVDSLKI